MYPDSGVATEQLNKTKQKKDTSRNEGWLLTYSDVITLLFTFVLIILKVSNIDDNKVEELREGLSQTFLKQDISTAYNTMSKEIEQLSDINQEVKVDATNKYVSIELNSSDMYEVGKADLNPNAVKILDDILAILLKDDDTQYLLEVEGHTDDVPIFNNEFESNWELSTARATKVVQYFEEHGIVRENMVAIGYADSKPLNITLDEMGGIIKEKRGMNRRISIKIRKNPNKKIR